MPLSQEPVGTTCGCLKHSPFASEMLGLCSRLPGGCAPRQAVWDRAGLMELCCGQRRTQVHPNTRSPPKRASLRALQGRLAPFPVGGTAGGEFLCAAAPVRGRVLQCSHVPDSDGGMRSSRMSHSFLPIF